MSISRLIILAIAIALMQIIEYVSATLPFCIFLSKLIHF